MSPSPVTNHPEQRVFRSCHTHSAWLYRPCGDWAYSHHASLTHSKGRYHAIWSNGFVNEDDVGQRVLTASSADFATWTEPRPLLDSQPGQYADAVLTAAGFHRHGETLIAYAGRYEYLPQQIGPDGRRRIGDTGHTGVTLLALTTEDGVSWSEPRDLKLPIIPNHGPERTRSGRLIISGNVMFPYTDDPTGLSGWTPAWVYGEASVHARPDDSAQFVQSAKEAGIDAPLCEGSWFQGDDGTLRLFLRSNTPRLWMSESRDDGTTWSRPVPTDFSDDASKFHFGRLPDGRFYAVGNPVTGGGRIPLILSLSDDGSSFDRHYLLGNETYERRVEGMHKGGQYGYPHTLIHDGWLCAIVSRCKEAVQVIRVRLADLD